MLLYKFNQFFKNLKYIIKLSSLKISAKLYKFVLLNKFHINLNSQNLFITRKLKIRKQLFKNIFSIYFML